MAMPVNLDRVSELVSTIGSESFNSEYFRLFNEAIDVEHCTVFAFSGSDSPEAMLTESQSIGTRLSLGLAREYCAGAYRHDPNVRTAALDSAPVVYARRATDIEDPGYRRRFYLEPRLSHELVVLGRISGTLFYASFYRTSQTHAFLDHEVDAAKVLASFAIRALNRHAELNRGKRLAEVASTEQQSSNAESRQQVFEHLRDALLAEPHKLSPREAEVCSCIVLGYTTLGISLKLNISLNTVATHRKRAYEKLRISSQNELFARYFRNVARFNVQLTQ